MKDEDNKNFIEEMIGRTSLPFAVIVVGVLAFITVWYIQTEQDQRQLRDEVARHCAQAQDFQACSNRITTVLKQIQTAPVG